MSSKEKQLPKGWIVAPLAQVIQPRGEKVSPSNHPEARFIGMDHVESHSTRILETLPASALKSSAARFDNGDVLYGRLRPYLNKVAQPNFDGLASAEFIVFPDTQLIKSCFLKYRLNAADFVSFASHLNEGDRPRVSFDQIGEFEILIPPPLEQGRIVVKIEELFSELGKGVESLKTARAQLKVYRQAVLKHAFEGKLTAQWREENKDKFEKPEQLLARIKQERAARYELQLRKWKAAVKTWEEGGKPSRKPRKPRAPKPLTTLAESQLLNLPRLPESWAWEKLGWMTCGVEYGTASKSANSGTVAVLRMGNIQNAKFDWTDLVYTSDDDEIAEHLLHDGDVLFNRTNSPELVGKTAIYRTERQAIFAGYLIRVNHIRTVVDSRYLNLFLNSHVARQYGNSVKRDGVNQSNISGAKLSGYPFPYCSIEEQHEIASILDKTLSLLDETEADVIQELQKAATLRQSILHKAFSGQLVDQNPHNEPASVLLDRIRADRKKKTVKNNHSKKTKRRKTAT